MIIKPRFTTSWSNAPTGATAVVQEVCSFLAETYPLAPIQLHITVGWGFVGNMPMQSSAVGESLTSHATFTYAQVRTALLAIGNVGATTLPPTDPLNRAMWIVPAQAKALGLMPPKIGSDGHVGFQGNVSTQIGTVPAPGVIDFYGLVAHEITEVMGRSIHNSGFATVLDLFHYSAPNVMANSIGGYFSTDVGNTIGNTFDTNPNFDAGDWFGNTPDAFNGFVAGGQINPISAVDLTLLSALGYR
ncbi:MAG TPA: NF038122 family metalloprotease [Candidatus Angelobacter sp.]|nr:NF038122 family metalloprotease [Candidatus Angelobacter sp.]